MSLERMLPALGSQFLRLSERGFVYGSQGRMLLRNLEEHWFLHNVTMSHYNVFLSEEITDISSFNEKYGMDYMSFGLAAIGMSKNTWNQDIIPKGCKVSYHKTAKLTIVNNDSDSKDFFHKIQKERKVWWRKLAQYPSRFKFAEARKVKNVDLVEVEAQFPFGTAIVETLAYHNNSRKLFPQADNSEKECMDAHMVESIVSLDWGCLAVLCDAYNTENFTNTRIHPRLAPYKVALITAKPKDQTNTTVDDLNRFVLYLNNMLRRKGLNTILTSSEEILNACLVPFVISADKTSLENGIIRVRNQSTTISEAVHVTDLGEYIVKRCR